MAEKIRVSVRELKSKLSEYLGMARKGAEIYITYHGQEVAMILWLQGSLHLVTLPPSCYEAFKLHPTVTNMICQVLAELGPVRAMRLLNVAVSMKDEEDKEKAGKVVAITSEELLAPKKIQALTAEQLVAFHEKK